MVNTKFDKNMSEIFGVSPTTESTEETESTGSTVSQEIITRSSSNINNLEPDYNQDLIDAYEQSKDNLQEIIEQGKEAMEEILQIAKEGQHPRAFEVYGNILKNMVDANKELLQIQKNMREIETPKQTASTNIDKAIFVGSTKDLSKMLKDIK